MKVGANPSSARPTAVARWRRRGGTVAPRQRRPRLVPWQPVAAEFAGTALLLAAGLSIVIWASAPASPLVHAMRDAAARRALTGALFGTVGASIAISPLGRESGAHLNPVVTLAFWAERRIRTSTLLAYVAAQAAGGIVGSSVLLAWGRLGRSVRYGATTPGHAGSLAALGGEAAATFALIALLFGVLGSPRLRHGAPLLFPPLYAVLVLVEAPLSGTSTNPARSLGPAVVSETWTGFWVYLAGPLVGTAVALAIRRLPVIRRLAVEVAKVHHLAHDPYRLFNGLQALEEG
jgi:aquaporin Z